MSNQAPAIGGATTSTATSSDAQKASAWQPYSILPPATRRKIDPRSTILSKPYLESLNIPDDVAKERIANKYLQLDPPEGKESDRRKAELAKRASEKEKRRIARVKQSGCGLVGKAKRKKLGQAVQDRISYEAVLPVHHLWLGYMSELLGLPLRIPTAPSTPTSGAGAGSTRVLETSTLYPMFPPRQSEAQPAGINVNVGMLHSKLVKAEFVGCILAVKRAKNPSLVGIKGLVLQETQGTFKLVTPMSQIKIIPKQGSVMTISLPLLSEDTAAASKELSFDLFGDQFAYRSAERVGKKWKAGSSAGEVQL